MLNAFDPFPHVRLTDQLYFPIISPGFSNKIARVLSETPHPQSNNKSLITLFPYQNLKLDQEQWLPRTASFPLSFSFFLAACSYFNAFEIPFPFLSNRTQNILSTAICADHTDSNRGILRILLLLCFHPHLGKKGSLGMRNTVQCKLPSIMEGDWSQSFPPFPALNLLLAS